VLVDVRRVAARNIANEVLLRAVDFGVLTFNPAERDLSSIVFGTDELVLLVPPGHALAGGGPISMEEMGRQVVIAPQRSVARARRSAAALRAASRHAEHSHLRCQALMRSSAESRRLG
jgi:DNA-binding transcriptional LysR family regulator